MYIHEFLYVVLLHDENSESWSRSFQQGLTDYDAMYGQSLDFVPVVYKNESDLDKGITG